MKFFRYLLFILVSTILFSCGNQKGNDKDTSGNDTLAKELQAINDKIHKDVRNPELYYERAQYYMKTGMPSDALANLNVVLQLDSSKSKYYLTLSEVYFTVNKTGESKKALEKSVALDPENTEALLKLAELYLYVSEHNTSIDYVNKALKVNKYLAKAYFIKGMNLKEMGDTATAISSFQTTVEQDAEYYNAFMQLGLLNAIKKRKIAVDYFNTALRLNPKSIEAHYGLGMFFMDMNMFDKAENEFNTITKIDAKYKDAYYNLGYIYYYNYKKYNEAIKYLSDAISCDSRLEKAYLMRAISYEKINNVESAFRDYQAVLTINSENEIALERVKALKK